MWQKSRTCWRWNGWCGAARIKQHVWELACSRAGDAVSQINRGAAIASKPAPTELSGRPRILGTLQNLWELACLRCRRCGQSVKPRCCYREQARSQRVQWQAPNSGNTAKPVGAGLPAMQAMRSDGHTAGIPSRASPLPQSSVAGPEFWEHCKTCGSWLACDAGDALSQINRGAAIASKPAPTEFSGRPRIR